MFFFLFIILLSMLLMDSLDLFIKLMTIMFRDQSQYKNVVINIKDKRYQQMYLTSLEVLNIMIWKTILNHKTLLSRKTSFYNYSCL
jgi:hypothetical protein